MADEQIVNTLGFNVSDALNALQRLDNAMQATGRAFGTFGDGSGHVQRPGSRGLEDDA